MQYSEREHLINKIVSGCTICTFDDKPVFVYEASAIDKVKAYSIYETELTKARLTGSESELSILAYMKRKGLWSDLLESELKQIPDKIDRLKLELYDAYFKFKMRDGIKKSLETIRFRERQLVSQRDRLKGASSEAYALSCKNKYLICAGARYADDSPVFTEQLMSIVKPTLIDDFIQDYFNQKIDESNIRYLAREEPFRSIWSAGKSEGSVFGKPASLLNQEQRLLIIWGKVYDNIYESPECPPEEVIEDDDCLDGWMALQGKKREEEKKKQHGYSADGKYNKSDEVFIMVENPEDVARVEAMNTPAAIFRKQQRMAAITRSGGIIEEQHMPDSQERMREQLVVEQRKRIMQR